jgi:membrane-associated phospholipid phosphatase
MPSPERSWLVHEIVFCSFLAVTLARLLEADAPAVHALVYAGYIAIALLLAKLTQLRPSARNWRLRLGYYFVLMNIVFLQMKAVVPVIRPGHFDTLLQSWDAWLVGGDLSVMAERFARPALTEMLSLCYGLFFFYLLAAEIKALRGPLERAIAFHAGLFSLYGVGFLGYTLLPALGPWLALAGQYHQRLSGWWVTELMLAIYPYGTNGADVFPSLHCAVSGFILGFDARHDPRAFRRWLLPVIGLWLSTIYLRFHYFVDVAAGLTLAMLALILVALVEGAPNALRPAAQRSSR